MTVRAEVCERKRFLDEESASAAVEWPGPHAHKENLAPTQLGRQRPFEQIVRAPTTQKTPSVGQQSCSWYDQRVRAPKRLQSLQPPPELARYANDQLSGQPGKAVVQRPRLHYVIGVGNRRDIEGRRDGLRSRSNRERSTYCF